MSFQAMTWAIEQTPTDAESKLVLLLLANYAGHDNSCWPSIKRLAAESLLCEATVKTKIKGLISNRYITVRHRTHENGDPDTNVYTLILTQVGQGVAQGGSPRNPGVGQGVAPNQSVEPIIEPRGKERTPQFLKDELRMVCQEMHKRFIQEANVEANQMVYDRIWYDLAKAGYKPDDVSTLIRYIKFENSRQEDSKFKRRFHIPRIFGDLAGFDADLSLAKAWQRNQPVPRNPVQDLRPIVDPESDVSNLKPSRTAAEITAQVKFRKPQPVDIP